MGSYNNTVKSSTTDGLKKKILIIRNAYSYDFGGGERIPVELAMQLKQQGHQPVIVSRSSKLLAYAQAKQLPAIKGWWWRFQDWSGIFLLLLPVYIAWQLLLLVWYIILILRMGVDVVHPQSRDDFIAATLASKLLGKRIVWTDHADLKYVYRNGRIWYKNPIGKFVFRLSKHARAVIVVSKNELTHIGESLGRDAPVNYKVIYNGVGSEAVQPASRDAKDKKAVIFAATSRLVTSKGIGELIDAFGSVDEKHPDTRLWLFGEGPEEEEFKAHAAANKHIVFWGFPDDTLSRVASADVFVHPSYHEGFSISLIEAAKLGLPIIACDVGGNPEIVRDGKNDLLVPPHNVNELADAMQKLAGSEELRRQYGKACRETYEKNLVWERLVKEELLPLYE